MNQIKLIQNEYFLTESSLAEYIKCDALPRLSFQNCKFDKVDFVGNVFGSCSFKDCAFKYLNTQSLKLQLRIVLLKIAK